MEKKKFIIAKVSEIEDDCNIYTEIEDETEITQELFFLCNYIMNNHSDKLMKLENPVKNKVRRELIRSRAIAPRKRFSILKRDNFTCVKCGKKYSESVMHVDHIIPFVKGGTNADTNLQTLCESCNMKKFDHNPELDNKIISKKKELELIKLENKISNRKKLTEKQKRCLEFLKDGKTIEDIAKIMNISTRSVYTHMKLIKKKGYSVE